MKMNHTSRYAAATLAATCGIAVCQAQPIGASNPDRVGLAGRMGFNITADFKHLGGFSPARTGGLNYDNGFIYPDATAASHPGYTWNYGYNAKTPQQPADAPTDFELYRSSASASGTSSGNTGTPQVGIEVTYNHRFGHLGRLAWGLEAGFGFTDVEIKDSRSFQGPVTRTTDTFRTGGGAVLHPAQPNGFVGNAQGPGPDDANGWPLVGLNPVGTRTDTVAGAATVTGRRELDAQIFSLRLGPYLELPVGARWNFSLSAGVAFLHVLSNFSFDETVSLDPAVTLGTTTPEQHRGTGSASELLVGYYAGGTIGYSLGEHWRVFAGVQFQHTGNFTQTVGGEQAVLNLGKSIYVPIGLSFSF